MVLPLWVYAASDATRASCAFVRSAGWAAGSPACVPRAGSPSRAQRADRWRRCELALVVSLLRMRLQG